jgi:hypothetical protein
MTQDTIRRMADAATAFLDALDETQRHQARLDFGDEQERTNWHYVPRERAGLPIKEMDAGQRTLALALVGTGLGAAAHDRAQTIMELESVLAQIEGPGRSHARDPELYYLSIFGDVGGQAPWGWRFEGHHISLNNTIVDGDTLSAAPLFFGANPAQVRHGEREGLRALAAEEDLARDLLSQLDGEQQRQAVIATVAPDDILTRNVVRVGDEVAPEGLPAGDMSDGQRQLLEALVAVYVERLPEALSAAQLQQLRSDGLAAAHFAWAGALKRGQGHYYRVLAPTFLAEYDNTQNDANHIHAVWRDLVHDFGGDLLLRHYRQDHT